MRDVCCVMLVDWRMTEKQMHVLGMKEPLDHLSVAGSVYLCGHLLVRGKNNVLRNMPDFNV